MDSAGPLPTALARPSTRPRRVAPARNDLGQYDELADRWWEPRGPFAMLHWLAAARARLVPPATRPGAVLLDLGCGAGLLAPHVAGRGYRHVGVDRTASALVRAVAHGVTAVRGDVTALPFPDGFADVVSAGEILEHVVDLDAAVGEACRVLRPGGVLVLDTIAATPLARVVAVTVAERVGGAPRGIHDPALLVDRTRLSRLAARAGVDLRFRGIRPSVADLVRFGVGRREGVRMVPTFSSAVLFQGRGVKSQRVEGSQMTTIERSAGGSAGGPRARSVRDGAAVAGW